MKVLRVLLLAVVVPMLLGAAWLWFVWPPPAWYRSHWPARTAFMRMRERQARARHDTTSLRYQPVPLDAISPWMMKAALAGEDEAFLEHHGIDWHSLRQALGYSRDRFDWSSDRDRAELRRVMGTAYAKRDKLRGASTITQQLAKNLYLSPSRNPLRKLKEAVIAYRLEWALPKERIMALYLNVAEFGPNLWGAEAASQRYFRTGAARLSIDQAALLVATLPHPLTSNPSLRPGRTRWRQALILRKLRGEPVEVPAEADETATPPPVGPDSAVGRTSGADTDTVRVPTDTDTTRAPADTTKPKTKPPER